MSVLGRVLFSSAQRIDLPDLLSIESYVASDFKYLVQSLVGDENPYIIKGFDVINPADAIGSQNISVRISDSVVFFPMSTVGAFYYGLPAGHPTSTPLIPDLKKNATNFIYLTFDTLETAQDTRAFWDPDKESGAGGEFTQDVNTESVLIVKINTSTASFPSDTIPVCKVVMGATSIQSIQDCRQLLFRLGTGGATPNPSADYAFKSLPTSAFERVETATLVNSNSGDNPFQGADKNIYSLKEWMDVVMTKIKEIGGTNYWYEDASSYNSATLFSDVAARNIKSKGKWEHSLVTEGRLTWSETIELQNTNDGRNIFIRSGNRTLANNQVLYVEMKRNLSINAVDAPVIWTSGTNYVNGDTGYFENLSRGDWIRPQNASNSYYYRVIDFYNDVDLTGGGGATPANAKSILIDGTSVFDLELPTVYTKGVYTSSELGLKYRNDPDLLELGGNFYWLAMRSDTINKIDTAQAFSVSGSITVADGDTARVECPSPHNLVDGDYITISSGAHAGTYRVEVESADVFYITTTITTLTSIIGFYAIVTTTDRTDPTTGFLLESENHGFESGQTIRVAGTAQYNGTHNINVRSDTQFNFAVPNLPAIETPSSATATLDKIAIRTESGVGRVIRGETRVIGSPETEGLMEYIGMESPDQAAPTYLVPGSYNAKDGQGDYNSDPDDNLTQRVAKLTAMMADRSQEKETIFALEGVDTITNATVGMDQTITFAGGAKKLTLNMPGSPGGHINLGGSFTLGQGEAAYFQIDRNVYFEITSLSSLTVTDIELVPLQENTFVFAMRGVEPSIFLWNGDRVKEGTYPIPQKLSQDVRVRAGVVDDNVYENYYSSSIVASYDSYAAAISKLDSELIGFIEEKAIEESQVVGVGGTTTFTALTLTWSPVVTDWDILVFVNGVKQKMDTSATSLEDYKKVNSTTIQFTYTVPQYAEITVRVERPHLVPIPSSFFRYDSIGFGGTAAFTSYNYDTGTEQLQVFRNGVYLIHSTLLATPVDQYTEQSHNTVTLGAACPTSEYLSFINLEDSPDYRDFITGQTTDEITVSAYGGSDRLLVFRNGVLMNKSGLGDLEDYYLEWTPTSVKLASAAIASEVFSFIHLLSAPANRYETSSVTGATINVGFTYTNGTKKLLVFRNGILLNSNSLGAQVDQYVESGSVGSSQTTIVLQQAATLGEVFTFILLG